MVGCGEMSNVILTSLDPVWTYKWLQHQKTGSVERGIGGKVAPHETESLAEVFANELRLEGFG